MKTAFRYRLRHRRLRSAYDLLKTRLSESEAEAENLNLNQSQNVREHALRFVYPSASASKSDSVASENQPYSPN